MKLCDKKHDEICYEGQDCPLCAMRKKLEKDIEDLELACSDLEDDLDDAQDMINKLENPEEAKN